MKFMEREITDIMQWIVVDSPVGLDYFPKDAFTVNDVIAMFRNVPISITITYGYGARLSANGYLDCTDWYVFDTEAEAEEHLDFLESRFNHD